MELLALHIGGAEGADDGEEGGQGDDFHLSTLPDDSCFLASFRVPFIGHFWMYDHGKVPHSST